MTEYADHLHRNVTLEKGALTFDSMLENDSDLTVETVDYPYFGDLNPPTLQRKLSISGLELYREVHFILASGTSLGVVTATPEQPEAQPSGSALRIPARSAIIVMEQ